MCGHFHGYGCHGGHHWRGPDPADLEERGLYYAGPCRCGHGPHAYYIDKDGRVVSPNRVVGEGEKIDRIAFLEDEVKSLKDCLDRRTGELEKLKAEQTKGT